MGYEFQGRTRARQMEESGRRPSRARAPREPKSARPAREERQPIHASAGLMGLAFLAAGIGGFIPGITTNYDELELAGRSRGPSSSAESG